MLNIVTLSVTLSILLGCNAFSTTSPNDLAETVLRDAHGFARSVYSDRTLHRHLSETNAQCLNDVCLFMESFTTCDVI